MPLAASFPPCLFRHASFRSSLSKTLPILPLPLPLPLPLRYTRRPFSLSSSSMRPFHKHPSRGSFRPRPMPNPSLSSLSTDAAPALNPSPDFIVAASTRSKKKARRESPEGLLRYHLDMCSKRGDLAEALRLYDAARAASTPLSLHHYNVLLYLCSSPSDATDGTRALGLERGFEIFHQMGADSISPNEATFTSVARLAAAKQDADLAFDLVKQMSGAGIPPRLRSYGPALFGFCKKGEVEKAHEVEAHMAAAGVVLEEPEHAALLRLNVEKGRGDDVYRLLHRMRAIVRQVSESTAAIAEEWFSSDAAAEVGVEEWDVGKVKEGVVKGGGGWHGQGWLGKGRWSVGRSEMDENGVCRRCGEKLVCIDIDPQETEGFVKSLASLACQRLVNAEFMGFQVRVDWFESMADHFCTLFIMLTTSSCFSI